VLRLTPARLVVDSTAVCDGLVQPHARVSVSRVLDRVHLLSAASICFARGLNDTPKIAALLVSARLFDARVSFLVIAAVMAIGGLLYAHRVARTMSQGLVKIDRTRGLAANVITASLVIFASKLGMPVSTTQVSVGSIAGTGFASNSVNWTTLRGILMSWVATLPIAGVIAYASTRLL
jgi:inorganic phosphate transporter, PiT family